MLIFILVGQKNTQQTADRAGIYRPSFVVIVLRWFHKTLGNISQLISSGIGELTYVSFAASQVMLLKKTRQIAGVWDAMTLMWRPRYISIMNMVHNCIYLYMYIVYFHFCGAFVIFAVIILCFSVDTIFSAYWYCTTEKDNGHAGSIHLTRLKCSQLCWCISRWIFWSCSSQGNTRDRTH